MTKYRTGLGAAFVAALLALFGPAPVARADIFQWEYINPANPSLGKQPSTTLAPDGAGAFAQPGAILGNRNLTKAYLIGAALHGYWTEGGEYTSSTFVFSDLSGTNFSQADLTNASLHGSYLTGAILTDAEVRGTDLRIDVANGYPGSSITLAQLYSTASYQAHDLTGIGLFGHNLTGANLAGQNLTNANLEYATLTGANLTGAEIRGASFQPDSALGSGSGLTPAQLYSTASYQAHNLSGIGLAGNFAGLNLASQNLTNSRLGNALLTNGNLSQANLTNAYIAGGALTGANLNQANLTGANLYRATLTGATMTGAEVRGTNFDRESYYIGGYGGTGITTAQLSSTDSYQAHDLTGISLAFNNLTGANLAGQILTNVNFHGATLTNANFSQTNLTDLHFAGATLAGANLSQANLTNAYFASANLTGANLTGAEIRGANFSDSLGISTAQIYATASYQAHDLSGINFTYNDLRGGNFVGQNLTNASFSTARLNNADFRQAVLVNTYFNYATLSGANFRQTNLANLDFSGASLTNANLSQSNVTNASLSGSLLTNANLSQANLTNANFRGATLTGANLTGAAIRGANFTRYYQAGNHGSGLTPVQLSSTASYQAHDLSGTIFAGNNLAGVNLAGQDLTGASFSSGTLTSGDFRQAIFTNTNLSFATLSGANFTQTNLTGVYFDGATLTGANLTGAEIRGANFHRESSFGSGTGLTPAQIYSTASYQAHDLTGIILAGNNLAGINLAGQNLTNASLDYATLTGASLTGAEIRGAFFHRISNLGSGTGLTPAQLYSTASYQAHDLSEISLAGDFTGLNLAGQNLTGASFRWDTDLTGANLSQANLTNANLGAATLTNANFSHANLANVDFTRTHLTGANLSQSNLTNTNFSGSLIYDSWDVYVSPGIDLTTANLSGADARGANFQYATLPVSAANTSNLIQSNGHIAGLDLTGGAPLVVRDYDGNPAASPPTGPLRIVVDEHLAMNATGALRLVFDADAWDSTISFAPGIPVARGGTLELSYAPDVSLASQLGRTIDLFDWTGVTPTGAFNVSSPFTWDLTRLYSTGEVTLLGLGAGIAGDFNGDNSVNAADLANWRNGFGTPAGATHQQGDADLDHDVDGFDFLAWQRQFTSGPAVAPAADAVPEPATFVLLIVAAAGWYQRHRRAA